MIDTELRLENRPESKPLECAVLFIDLRSSTIEAADRARSAEIEAARIAVLYRLLLEHSPVNFRPDFTKSTGDGLMSAWHLQPGEQRLLTLRAVLSIAVDLWKLAGPELAKRLGTGAPPIGIGLTRGSIAIIEEGPVHDYIGFTANLAAKLQDCARPRGLVVQDRYVSDLAEFSTDLYDFLQKAGLSRQYVLKGSVLSEWIQHCWISSDVCWMHNWRCLAWPGFASPSSKDGHGTIRAGGLNTRGITVLTHEGLQGKIGTLEIWSRYVAEGDSFEIIIDDFDALQIMTQQDTLNLRADIGDERERIATKICSDLYHKERSGFFFIPIRCGINALIWNREDLPWFPKVTEYKTIRDLLDLKSKGGPRLRPSDIGFYDVMGGTLPILALMMNDEIQQSRVYDSGDAQMDAVSSDLKKLTDSHGDQFQLFEKASDLSRALHDGVVKLVLGGGPWLIRPDLNCEVLDWNLPDTDGGLLWVEGAAITRNAANVGKIVEFLSAQLLNDDYQLSLGDRPPYGSSPVTTKIIASVLNDATKSGEIDLQTKVIYEKPSKINRRLIHRRCPTNVRAWLDAWSDITSQCCVRIQSGH